MCAAGWRSEDRWHSCRGRSCRSRAPSSRPRAAALTNSCTSRDLPIPGSPTIVITCPEPRAARSSSSRRRAISASRPTNCVSSRAERASQRMRKRRFRLQRVQLDRLRDTLELLRLEARELDESFRASGRICGQPDLAESERSIDMARQPRHGTDGVVVPRALVADRADDRLSGMDADPYIERLTSERRDRLAHRERGVASAHRMVLVRERRAEQCRHAIVPDVADRASKVPDRIDHRFQNGIDAFERRLGIRAVDRLTDASAKHSELLALGRQYRRRFAGPIRGCAQRPGVARTRAQRPRRARREPGFRGRSLRPAVGFLPLERSRAPGSGCERTPDTDEVPPLSVRSAHRAA